MSEQVIRTLLYFDLFSYPLNAGEIYNFLSVGVNSQADVKRCLADLTQRKLVFRFGDLYSLQPEDKNIIRRIKGNDEAVKWLKIAQDRAQLIAKFPFVRAVMASGSLSKGYMDENSDLDFFIVTTPNRLWVARTLLVLYKRIFLLNSHKKFCVNYFIDTRNLEIEEKNLFTATELITLIPLHNQKCYRALMDSNDWVRHFFPNFKAKYSDDPKKAGSSRRNIFEFMLNPVSDSLDRFFMRMTLSRWNKLYRQKFDKRDFDIAFKTRRHVSKNHPNHYQKKILEQYQKKIVEYKTSFGRLENHA